MRNIFLTAVVVCALAVAGIGGVFANYQDIDISYGNKFETGSLDLKVSQYGFLYDSPNIPTLIDIDDAMPECFDKSFHFDLHNAGNYTQGTGWVYLHVNKLVCIDTGKTEPELAAETGATPIGEDKDGNPVYAVPPLGTDWGTANCELAEHISFAIQINYVSDDPTDLNWTAVNLTACDTNHDGKIKLNEVVCKQVLIGELDSRQTMWVWVTLMLQDIPEEDLEYYLFEDPSEFKWNDWPTNALQDDQVTFDMSFELFQFKLP